MTCVIYVVQNMNVSSNNVSHRLDFQKIPPKQNLLEGTLKIIFSLAFGLHAKVNALILFLLAIADAVL